MMHMATNRTLKNSIVLYHETGTCEEHATRDRRCAMQPDYCEKAKSSSTGKTVMGEKYVAGAYNSRTANVPGVTTQMCDCENTPVGVCLKNSGTIKRETLNKDFRCAANSHSCESTETFLFLNDPIDGEFECGCNGLIKVSNQEQVDEDGLATLYGACRSSKSQKDHFCAYSPDACEFGHEWIPPTRIRSSLGLECHCENVRVGGCVNGFYGFHCGATAEDCAWGTYLPPVSLKLDFGEECRLCLQTSSTLPPDEISTLKAEVSKTGLGAGAILGITAACLLLFGVISSAGFRILRKRKMAMAEAKEVSIHHDEPDSTLPDSALPCVA